MTKENVHENENYNSYEELANAIVIQACEDYKRAYACYLRRGDISTKRDPVLSELEYFFRSAWYKTLTEVDGEYLIERLRNEVEKMMKKPK